MAVPSPAPLRPAITVLLSLLIQAAPAMAQEILDLPQEITLDFDGDRLPDRVILLAAPEDDDGDQFVDLHIHLGATRSVVPDLVRKAFTRESIVALESPAQGRLSITTCYGCNSMRACDATLTIVFRDGLFLVERYERGWEWSTRLADGNVDVLFGGCEIDFLTGNARVGTGINEMKPTGQRFKPVALADWSDANRPAICKFRADDD